MVVHHMTDIRNIQSAGSQIGRDEDRATAVAELVESAFPLVLFHSPVKDLAGHPFRTQVVPDALGTLAVIAKDQSLFRSQHAEQPVEGLDLVFFGRYYLIYMDTFCRPTVCLQKIQPHGAVHPREARNLFGIGGREQEATAQGRQPADDLSHFLLETEFQTLVELIDNERGHGSSLEIRLSQMVVHTARRTDDDRRTDCLHRPVFVHGRTTAVAAHHCERSPHRLEDLFGLQGQFTRRNQHHRLHSLHTRAQRLHQGEQVRQGLARPRGGKQHQIVSFLPSLHGGLLHGSEPLYFQILQYFFHSVVQN